MGLSVIGSGFGRTGTKSIKLALEELGLGPCHHMEEVFANPDQPAFWRAVADRRPVDWDLAFTGFSSQIDWPGAHVWRELAEAYPQAKVIHSVRPDESWWNSFSGTIGKFLAIQDSLDLPPPIQAVSGVVSDIVGTQTFAGQFGDKDKALAAYHQRLADVKASIPAERLLVFDVAEGWAPLCAFLGVPVPDAPFPRTNDRADFWAKLGGEPA